MIYGYCRISTSKQNIERQERNILAVYPNAVIFKEIYTGTKKTGRVQLEKILKKVKSGDTIVFDSVSRMSRNADEGVRMYKDLYEKGVELVFLKEQHINTAVYRKTREKTIEETENEIANIYIQATNKVLMLLAEEQVRITFEQAEKEVTDLHQRTKEGIETARANGKQIGNVKGCKLCTKKSVEAKAVIRKHSKAFGGSLNDIECIKQTGLSRNTFYKYKKEIAEEIRSEQGLE